MSTLDQARDAVAQADAAYGRTKAQLNESLYVYNQAKARIVQAEAKIAELQTEIASSQAEIDQAQDEYDRVWIDSKHALDALGQARMDHHRAYAAQEQEKP